jgi:hypothetical protein
MSRPGASFVERILHYLEQQERKALWSGTTAELDSLRSAWWTLYLAFYQNHPDPAAAASRKVYGADRPPIVKAGELGPAEFEAPPRPAAANLETLAPPSAWQWIQVTVEDLE